MFKTGELAYNDWQATDERPYIEEAINWLIQADAKDDEIATQLLEEINEKHFELIQEIVENLVKGGVVGSNYVFVARNREEARNNKNKEKGKDTEKEKEKEKEESPGKSKNDVPNISYDYLACLKILETIPMDLATKEEAILYLDNIQRLIKEIEGYQSSEYTKYFYGPMQHAVTQICNIAEELYELTEYLHETLANALKTLIIETISPFKRELSKRMWMPLEEQEDLRIKTKRLYAEQSFLCRQEKLQKRLMEHLGKIKQLLRGKGEPSPRCYISYAWPSKENRKEEYWVQPFLYILYGHLKAAGIRMIMDIRDNQTEDSICRFMRQCNDGNYIILVGTESLLQKHYSPIFHAVQTELSIISNRFAQDQKVYGSSRICPLLLSGNIKTSFPEIYDKYRTVKYAIDEGYIPTLRFLLEWMYKRQINKKIEMEYGTLWHIFDKNCLGLPKEADSQAIEEELNIGYHRKSLDELKQDLSLYPIYPDSPKSLSESKESNPVMRERQKLREKLAKKDHKQLSPKAELEDVVDELPKGYELGETYDNKDSFFDALAQSLNALDNANHTAKKLRMFCSMFYGQNSELVDNWNQDYSTSIRNESVRERRKNYENVQFTPEACKEYDLIYGQPAVEGRILCRHLGLDRICVIELDKYLKKVISFYLIDKDEYQPIDAKKTKKLMHKGDLPALTLVNKEIEPYFLPLLKSNIKEKPKEKKELPRLILSLDGGGIRGVLQAYLLNHLEKRLEEKIKKQDKNKEKVTPAPDIRLGECFDLIAGTSTGGMIALAMRVLDPKTNRSCFKLQNIVELYEKNEGTIFPSVAKLSFKSSNYKSKSLENLLKKYFSDQTLADLSVPTIITSCNFTTKKLHLFRSYKAKDNPKHNFALNDVARATSGASTFFPIAEIKNRKEKEYRFIDGSAIANNPTLNAYNEAIYKLYPSSTFHIISLGTVLLEKLKDEKSSKGIGRDKLFIEALIQTQTKKVEDDTAEILKRRQLNGKADIYTRLQVKFDPKLKKVDNVKNRFENYVDDMSDEKHSTLQFIENTLLKFYEFHNYYVFYPLVESACKQVKENKGKVDLSRSYLHEQHMPYLAERGMWEITHALSKTEPSVTALNLSGNSLLSSRSLIYLGKLKSNLTMLDLSDTNLTLEGLEELKKLGLALNVLTAQNNPVLEKADPQRIRSLTICYRYVELDARQCDEDIPPLEGD